MLLESFGVLVVLCLVMKFYVTVGHVYYKPTADMRGKTIIITGANRGIGYETALGLSRCGARIIMACRNVAMAEVAKAQIIKETNNTEIITKKLDISSEQSVREFAADINATEPKIDVLIHNAGIVQLRMEKSVDGIEKTMATNHYGPFLLTHLLYDLLKRSAPSRIIVVSSFGHFFHWNQPIDPFPDAKTWHLPYNIYFQSKLANIYFTQELARRIANSGVTVNCLNPGMIKTDIYKSVSPFPFNLFVNFTKLFYGTVEEGSHTILYLATAPEGGKVSGQYFSNCKIYRKTFGTPEIQRELFEISAERMLRKGDPRI